MRLLSLLLLVFFALSAAFAADAPVLSINLVISLGLFLLIFAGLIQAFKQLTDNMAAVMIMAGAAAFFASFALYSNENTVTLLASYGPWLLLFGLVAAVISIIAAIKNNKARIAAIVAGVIILLIVLYFSGFILPGTSAEDVQRNIVTYLGWAVAVIFFITGLYFFFKLRSAPKIGKNLFPKIVSENIIGGNNPTNQTPDPEEQKKVAKEAEALKNGEAGDEEPNVNTGIVISTSETGAKKVSALLEHFSDRIKFSDTESSVLSLIETAFGALYGTIVDAKRFNFKEGGNVYVSGVISNNLSGQVDYKQHYKAFRKKHLEKYKITPQSLKELKKLLFERKSYPVKENDLAFFESLKSLKQDFSGLKVQAEALEKGVGNEDVVKIVRDLFKLRKNPGAETESVINSVKNVYAKNAGLKEKWDKVFLLYEEVGKNAGHDDYDMRGGVLKSVADAGSGYAEVVESAFTEVLKPVVMLEFGEGVKYSFVNVGDKIHDFVKDKYPEMSVLVRDGVFVPIDLLLLKGSWVTAEYIFGAMLSSVSEKELSAIKNKKTDFDTLRNIVYSKVQELLTKFKEQLKKDDTSRAIEDISSFLGDYCAYLDNFKNYLASLKELSNYPAAEVPGEDINVNMLSTLYSFVMPPTESKGAAVSRRMASLLKLLTDNVQGGKYNPDALVPWKDNAKVEVKRLIVSLSGSLFKADETGIRLSSVSEFSKNIIPVLKKDARKIVENNIDIQEKATKKRIGEQERTERIKSVTDALDAFANEKVNVFSLLKSGNLSKAFTAFVEVLHPLLKKGDTIDVGIMKSSYALFCDVLAEYGITDAVAAGYFAKELRAFYNEKAGKGASPGLLENIVLESLNIDADKIKIPEFEKPSPTAVKAVEAVAVQKEVVDKKEFLESLKVVESFTNLLDFFNKYNEFLKINVPDFENNIAVIRDVFGPTSGLQLNDFFATFKNTLAGYVSKSDVGGAKKFIEIDFFTSLLHSYLLEKYFGNNAFITFFKTGKIIEKMAGVDKVQPLNASTFDLFAKHAREKLALGLKKHYRYLVDNRKMDDAKQLGKSAIEVLGLEVKV